MVTNCFTQINIGDTGGGVIRSLIHSKLILTGRVKCLGDGAHETLRQAREIACTPSFAFIRNPWDWYISRWIHELKTRRWRGSFHSFMTSDAVGSLTALWTQFTTPGLDRVGRFEHLPGDLASILSTYVPDLPAEEVLNWFPDAWRQWCNRQWCESIEQWMRDELFSADLIHQVETQDSELIKTYGYSYADRHLL